MTDLVEFVSARLDDEATGAWAVHDVAKCDALLYAENIADAARAPDCECGRPAQVRREVEAMRVIVRRCAVCMDETDQYANALASPRAVLARQILMSIAGTWSAHPDYDPAWTPAALTRPRISGVEPQDNWQ